MSANIYWRPLDDGTDLGVSAPSSFIELLENLFENELPFRLGRDNETLLRAAARIQKDKNFKEHLEDLANAVEKFGNIEVSARY